MPFNGSGVFNRVHSWATDKANNVLVTASRMDAEDNGFATGLSNCITADGQTTPSADIPLGGNKIVDLADGTTATDAMAWGQFTTRTQLFVTKNGGQAITSAAPVKTITWTVQQDTLSEWDAVNNRWVCTDTGVYLMSADIDVSNSSAGNVIVSGGFLKNGAINFSAASGYSSGYVSNVLLIMPQHVTVIVPITAGDYIELWVGADNLCSIRTECHKMSILRVG